MAGLVPVPSNGEDEPVGGLPRITADKDRTDSH
jgi:hypothetical protein